MYDDMMTPALKQPFTLLSACMHACMHVIKLELSFQNHEFLNSRFWNSTEITLLIVNRMAIQQSKINCS